MKNYTLAIGALALSLALAACGGGGSSSSGGLGGGIIPATPTPTVTPTAQPSPTTAPPTTSTVSGKVVQVTGPLSSSTWNFAEPTGCGSTVTSPCTTYPTPPPTLPSVNATPGVGSGIASATVYAVANAEVSGIPSHPIAVATTAPDGSFSITLPAGSPATIGLIAANGTFDPATGATVNNESLAHANVAVGNAATLYIDTLSPDEIGGFTALNQDRAAIGLAPITSDTLAEAYARATVSTVPGSPACTYAAPSWYPNLGGVGSLNIASDEDGPQLPAILQFDNSLWNNQADSIVGLAGLYQVPACGGVSFAANYYIEAYAL